MNDQTPQAVSYSAEEKQWAMFCHLSGLLGFLGPLVLWLIKKDTMPLVDRHGKEALNFQITLTLAWMVVVVLSAVTFGILGLVLMPLMGFAWLGFVIWATIKVSNGDLDFKYPFALRLVN